MFQSQVQSVENQTLGLFYFNVVDEFIFSVQVYTCNILGGMFLNGAIPLFYELGAESAFPVSEGVVGGFLTWLNNVFGIIFLFMLQIPGIGWYQTKIRLLFTVNFV